MTTVTLSDDIPDRTSVVEMLTTAEWETIGLSGDGGFVNFDIDQAAEIDESDVTFLLKGKGLAADPIPVGSINGIEIKSLDTGSTWASILGLPDVDAFQFVFLITNPGTTVEAFGDLLFGDNDSMAGGAADDLLSGFDGKDQLSGNGGQDFLYGGRGADVIDGGAGRDRLVGQGGGDFFQFSSKLRAANADRIADFGRGNDKFLLDTARFDTILSMTGPGVFVIGTAAADGDSRIIYDDATGRLYFDSDGTGAAAQKLFAIVDKGTVLEASDFLLLS